MEVCKEWKKTKNEGGLMVRMRLFHCRGQVQYQATARTKKKKQPKNEKEHKSMRANKELDLDQRTKESILEEEMTLELLHRS